MSERLRDPTDAAADDARWLVVNGRRWRRTDPCLPPHVVEALTAHLGRGRSGVRTAKRAGDDAAVASAREREALRQLDALDRANAAD